MGGVPGVNPDHLAALLLGLVHQERAKLGEGPGVQAAAGLPAPLLCPSADIHQVLNYDGSARGDRINDATAQHVVAVPPETVDLPCQSAEMPSGRAGAFGLEPATELEVPTVNPPPAAGAEETVVRGNGGTVQPEVYANGLTVALKRNVRKSNHHVEPEAAFPGNQVCAAKRNSPFQ